MTFLPDGKQKTVIFALLVLITAMGCATVTERLERTEKWVKSLNEDTPDENAAPHVTQEASPALDFHIHRVTWAGESLSIVAKWYTGNLENWKSIAKANPEIKPDLLRMGMRIRIPEALLLTHDPMPQEFVASHYSKDTKGPKSSQSAAEDLPLIGPKSYSDK